MDAANPQIVAQHLVCAAAEEPLAVDDEFLPPVGHPEAVRLAMEDGKLLLDAAGTRYFTPANGPSAWWTCAGPGRAWPSWTTKARWWAPSTG